MCSFTIEAFLWLKESPEPSEEIVTAAGSFLLPGGGGGIDSSGRVFCSQLLKLGCTGSTCGVKKNYPDASPAPTRESDFMGLG